MDQSSELKLLLQIVDEGYQKKTWHGSNLKGSIRGLTAKEAAWRPSSHRHNIWEIVVHTAYWKYIVRRRILGEKKGSFPMRGSNWFKRPEEMSEQAWKQDVKLLDNMHTVLVEAIEQLKRSDLNTKPKGSTVTNRQIIWGIAAHDVYHAGQIQLLKRLMK